MWPRVSVAVVGAILIAAPPRGSCAAVDLSRRQVRQAIDRFTDARNEHPIPFEWTKSVVPSGRLKARYADL